MRESRIVSLIAVVLLGAALAFPLGAIAGHGFTDVPDSNPYHADIDGITDVGVTTGCGGGKYCPKDFVTREQMAAFLDRLGALNGGGHDPVVDAAKLDGIDSAEFIKGTGRAYIERAQVDLSGIIDPDEERFPLGGVGITDLGSLTVGGANGGPGQDCDITFTNTSGASLLVNGAASAPLADGASIELVGVSARPDAVSSTFSIASIDAVTVASGQVVVMFGFPGASNVRCAGSVQALVSR